jgi:cardiolipin synthase
MGLANTDVWWPYAASLLVMVELAATAHAVLNKREVRSAMAWVALIWLVPVLGVLLYSLLGINRIDRVAARVRAGMLRYEHTSHSPLSAEQLEHRLENEAHLAAIARTVERTSRWPLFAGNRVKILRDGDEAYPEMLRCIESARQSIAIVSFIFDSDAMGRRFVDALAAARDREVEVRVLIDDAGARYTWPPVDRLLWRRGVTASRFLRVWAPWSAGFANLHDKPGWRILRRQWKRRLAELPGLSGQPVHPVNRERQLRVHELLVANARRVPPPVALARADLPPRCPGLAEALSRGGRDQ